MGRISVYGASDVGMVRQNNEDSLVIDEEHGLAAVADGMGGEACGEVASAITVRMLKDWFARNNVSSPRRSILREAVRNAHYRVQEEARTGHACQGMGSTVVAASWDLPGVDIANVGDSRAYLVRGGQLKQLTTDQNLGNQMKQRSGWTDEQVANFPQRHILTSAIGAGEDVTIQLLSILAEPGDRFLLCSDGLYGPLGDEELARILLEPGSQRQVVEHLLGAAREAGGPDNITAILLDVVAE